MSPAKQQGTVEIRRGKWVVRWRETALTRNGPRREQKLRVIREVTADDRRHKVRAGGAVDPSRPKAGRLSIPQDIEAKRKEITGQAEKPGVSALLSIAEIVEDLYFRDIEKTAKPSTMKGYRNLWRLHLNGRIGGEVARDFQRTDAFKLWSAISSDNPTMRVRTMRNIRFFLSGVFRWAAARGMSPAPIQHPSPASPPTR